MAAAKCDSCGRLFAASDVVPIGGRNICVACKPAVLQSLQQGGSFVDVNDLFVEGGSATATAFLSEDLVDRILIYRAPIIVGEGKSSFGYVGLDAIADAHDRWRFVDERRLGVDRLEVYERMREA